MQPYTDLSFAPITANCCTMKGCYQTRDYVTPQVFCPVDDGVPLLSPCVTVLMIVLTSYWSFLKVTISVLSHVVPLQVFYEQVQKQAL